MKVELIYFKSTGKYYTEGEYETEKPQLYEIWDEVQSLRKTKSLPGILGDEWIILVNVPGHPHEHPKLLFKWNQS